MCFTFLYSVPLAWYDLILLSAGRNFIHHPKVTFLQLPDNLKAKSKLILPSWFLKPFLLALIITYSEGYYSWLWTTQGLIYSPPSLFLSLIWGSSASSDSTNHKPCSSVVFSIQRYLSISRPIQFKPKLFKGQLYSISELFFSSYFQRQAVAVEGCVSLPV